MDNVGPAPTDTDVFVTQLDHNGTGLLWSTYIGGTNPVPASFNDDEIGMGVARAVSGAVCITGFTTDDDFPQVNAIQSTSNFGEAFVARLSGGGTTLDFSTYLGGDFWDVGTGIATDVDENVYVCGYTDSWTGCLPNCRAFPTMGSVIEPAHTGSAEAGFLSKFDSTGAMLLSTFVRAASAESGISARCWGVALDPDETDPTRVDVWLTGDLKDAGPGDDFHLTPNAFQPSFAGGSLSTDGLVVGLNDTFSSVRYGSYLGGELDDVGLGIDVYPDSKIAVVGQTRSTAFPIANAPAPSARSSNGPDSFNRRRWTRSCCGSTRPEEQTMNTIAPSLGSSLVLVFAASAVAQTGIIHEVTEESSAFDWLGYTMDSAGDVDGDGWMDVFVGIPRYNPSGAPYPNGAVGVYSGFDGSRLKLGVDAYIDLEGTPTPGGEVSLFALSGEFVPTMAALFLGATGTSLPAGHGCTLYVGPPQIVAFLPTDEFGRIDYAFDTPVTFPLGPIHVQAFFADAKTPVGFTATAGRVIDFQ